MAINDCVLALILTIVIELAAAYLLGYGTRRIATVIVCVNLITHPLFCYFLWVNYRFSIIPINYTSIIVLEILITVVESILFCFATRRKYFEMLKLAFYLNATSFLLGLLIFNNDF